ncbi:MAG: histone deacetylase [Candidatus Obscuribacterales bacterium]|nr:histone deacetylase [Candidatus Obscuribacterales bacterium]
MWINPPGKRQHSSICYTRQMITPLVFSPLYNTDLASFGMNKPFALDRGELVLRKLREELPELEHHLPVPLTDEELLLVHTPQYLQSLQSSSTWEKIFELKEGEYQPHLAEKPLHQIINDFKLKGGGTKIAVNLALQHGLAANLGAGYHHAFPDRGHGYCALHDIGIAIKSAQNANNLQRAMIVDLDFHQGDGSAIIFASDDSVFTLSVHSEDGWPDVKQHSDLDVPIFENEEKLYLEKTADGIHRALKKFAPNLVLFIAGSDPYEKDVLPGTQLIKLPLATMRERDEFVIDTFADKGIPLAKVFAGGYGPDVWEVHYWATRHLLVKSGFLQSSGPLNL